jgi:hypothetical protein
MSYIKSDSDESTPPLCFICHDDDGTKIVSLKTRANHYEDMFYKRCTCDGGVHRACVNVWYDKTMKCPICREKLVMTIVRTTIWRTPIWMLNLIYDLSFTCSSLYFTCLIYSNPLTPFWITGLRVLHISLSLYGVFMRRSHRINL